MKTLELTPAEIAFIEAKRIADAEALLAAKTEEERIYDENLKTYRSQYEKSLREVESNATNVKKAFEILKEKCPDVKITLETFKGTPSVYRWYEEPIKQEDRFVGGVECYKIETPYGTIGTVCNSLTSYLPYKLQGKYMQYKIETIAKKINTQAEVDRVKEESISKLKKVIEDLTSQFLLRSPEGTSIEHTKEWIKNYYGRDKGYYQDMLAIKFPNGSRLTLNVYASGNYNVYFKHDSKITPTNADEWFDYLKS